ncbi:MAG: serine/threonine protein kinase [Myxococcales bacterium]|nr:serine/threonine protein kinase [Myxococcales bacterium]
MAHIGRYELVRPIAQGGMATVYLAKVRGEGGFERLVALKVMHPHISNEPDFVSMFLDEARLAARIRHPNVVPTLAVERNDDGLCLVMEYIEGHALHSILRTALGAKKHLSIPVALRIVVDLLEGLHAAHELRDEEGHPLDLVHRDVSPQNVLVGADGVSRITDFGVAHARARLATTQGSGLKGKVAYLAPEQVMTTGKVDRRADVFAAGIVLWEALTGRRLFRGETEGQTIAQIMAGAQRAPREVRSDVPLQISDVCMKALTAARDDRFQTAVDFADALEAAATAAGVPLAKPREVAAEILSLDVKAPPIDAAKLHTGPAKSGSSSGISRGSATGDASALVASTPAAARTSKARWLGLGAAGVVAVVALGLVLGVRSGDGKSAAVQPTLAASTAPSVEATPEPTPPAPAKPEPAPEPEVSAAPSPSAAPPASASAKPAQKTQTPSSRPTRPSAPGYRPEGL